MDISEIAATLRDSPAFREQIGRDTGMYTVALFPIYTTEVGDRLRLAGTGTLITFSGSYYILTAAHVWEKVLISAARIGITLRENLDHEFSMNRDTIVTFGEQRAEVFDEWGPDLIFIRIPSEHVVTISAFRVFYSFPEVDASPLGCSRLDTLVLMGTPHVLGNFEGCSAEVIINCFILGTDTQYEVRGDYDYYDFEMELSEPGMPQTFGGVSGGGLWRVQIY